MSTKSLTRTLVIVIRVVMAVGGVLVVTLPWTAGALMRIFADERAGSGTYVVFITVFYMLVGVLVIWGLGEAQAMVATDGAFTKRNSRALTRAGWLSMVTAALFTLRTILYPDATSVLVVVAAVLIGLACFTLSQVVAQAAAIKAENDLTI
ncbi:MAG: DUF2975 domain-containing protein [Bifidobacteriaceae bacterium]|jgi:hypothetical protein|nr:DUF2975 domain-containing protein [Bifidobacteriaceae bacterium]